MYFCTLSKELYRACLYYIAVYIRSTYSVNYINVTACQLRKGGLSCIAPVGPWARNQSALPDFCARRVAGHRKKHSASLGTSSPLLPLSHDMQVM